jgi:hypothetical protein
MPQLIEAAEHPETENQTQADKRHDEQRATLRRDLDEIASEVSRALHEVDLNMPVYFSVPSSGAAILTFMTPVDPSDEDWSRATKIVCDVASRKVQMPNLIGQALRCAPSGSSKRPPEAG